MFGAFGSSPGARRSYRREKLILVAAVDKTELTGQINANPNPVCFGQRCVISWDTNDPVGAEVRVSTAPDDEKLVSQGERAGQIEVPWIVDSKIYDFRLYSASWPDKFVDSVKVRRDLESSLAALREIADQVSRGNIDMKELSHFIAAAVSNCLGSVNFPDMFRNWERHGFHVTPVHFYQPIPDTQSLPETLWDRPSELVGIDMNSSVQLDLLQTCFPKFQSEYERFPTTPTEEQGHFYLNNHLFDGTDALVAYCMVRHFQPHLIVEIGSGFSSLLLGQAAAKNNISALICIEP